MTGIAIATEIRGGISLIDVKAQGEVISLGAKSSKHPSGRYLYKYWATASDGERKAVWQNPDGRAYPDLISTTYINGDGSEVLYGIVFDFDVERAELRWLDSEGRLHWEKIKRHLFKMHPEIAKYITHVVRSTGGKGLAVVLGINPLPLGNRTEANQEVGRSLQKRLITLFRELGFGADPSALGLKRDFPNFKDPKKLVDRNEVMQRRLEKEKIAVMSELHAYLNKVDAEKRRVHRIYNDARVEMKLAKLVLVLLGLMEFKTLSSKQPLPFSGDSMWFKVEELKALTACSRDFLYEFLNHPPEWLFSRYDGRNGWELAIPLSGDVSWLLARAEKLVQNSSCAPRFSSLSSLKLKHPSEVCDGERNAWIAQLALFYKFTDYSYETALRKVLLRVRCIEGAEQSRNVKQATVIVKSIYKNKPENQGIMKHRELPDWVKDDQEFHSVKLQSTSLRRGETPVGLVCCVVEGNSNQEQKGVCDMSSSKLRLWRSLDASIIEADLSCIDMDSTMVKDKNSLPIVPGGTSSSPLVVKLVAIRRKQRIGIFDGNKLVVCLTSKHYKAQNLLEALLVRKEYKGKILKLHTPHKHLHNLYYAQIDAFESPICGEILCGKKPTKRENMQDWREKRGIEYVPSFSSEFVEEDDVPF